MKNKPTLKQFHELKPHDFESHPIWIHCHGVDYDEEWYGEVTEETFRPWIGNTPASSESGMFLVKSQYTLADGSKMTGFITPLPLGGAPLISSAQPQIFLSDGQFSGFWFGIMKPEIAVKVKFYMMMEKPPSSIFPIKCNIDPTLISGKIPSLIAGFSYYEGGKFRAPIITEI